MVEVVLAGSEGPTPHIVKAQAALAKSDLSAARVTLDEVKYSWPEDPDVLMLEARVVEAEGPAINAQPLYRQAANALAGSLKERPNGNLAIVLANALCKCGDLDAAQSALAEAARLGAPRANILRAERAVAFARKDLGARRQAAEAVIAAADRTDVWDWVQLAIACRDLTDRDAAAAAAARALELDPVNGQAARIASWAANYQAAAKTTPKVTQDAKTSSAIAKGPADLIAKSQQALAKRDISGARAALDEAKRSWPDDPDVPMIEARVVEAEGDLVAAKGLYRTAVDALAASLKQTPNGGRAVALANALCKCGELDAAQTAVAEAARLGAPRSNVLRVERSIAFARDDLPAMRRAAEAIVEAGDRVDAWDWVNLAVARFKLDDVEGAAAAAAQALALDPLNAEAVRVSSLAAVRQGDSERAIRELRRATGISPDDPRSAFQLARTLSLTGRPVEAADVIGRALERWPNNSSIRAFALVTGFRTVDQIPEIEGARDARNVDYFREEEMRRLARILPSDSALLRPAIVDDLSKDVIVGRAHGSEKLVLVFTAPNHAVNMPIAMFDRYLAALGINAIYLKDFNRVSHLQGVVSLGDSFESTISALRGLLEDMRARRVLCVGASAGGFAAIRYGAELGVERVVSFAGQTYDAPGELAKLELGAALILRQRRDRFSSEAIDLAPFLRSRRSTTRFELFYPEKAPRDTEQARHLEGIEGVTLHPVADCDSHELLRWMALREDLGAQLADLLGS